MAADPPCKEWEWVDFGQTNQDRALVEYALIIAVIAITIIIAMIFLRDQLSNQFSNIGNNLT